MTNVERLQSLLGFEPPKNALEGALIDAGIMGGSTYVAATGTPLKKLAISLMEILLTTPDTGNSEVGFNINFDRDSVLKRIKILKGELGIEEIENKPSIQSVSRW